MSELPLGEHLEADETAAYLDDAVESRDRARIDAHLAACAQCREEIVDAGRIVATLPAAKRASRRIWMPAAIAAALLLFVARPGQISDSPIVHREAPVTAIVAPQIVAPSGPVELFTRLVWGSAPGADSYHVRLFGSDGTVLWEQSTTDTTAALPDSLRLVAGRSYYWKVEAQTGFDRRAASELIEFIVRPRQ